MEDDLNKKRATIQQKMKRMWVDDFNKFSRIEDAASELAKQIDLAFPDGEFKEHLLNGVVDLLLATLKYKTRSAEEN